ncbi:diguanylate cyclase [Methylobacterium sp. Leaf104]|uniref:GGDEF domain-containing protein n=1 Tax=Methylobacterium TaxID=407 RepID=UPI0006FC56BB|nr:MULTISPECIES: GGDEF domain-containing protein [Methylobacterium]KQP38327.1 diguanylate cyclase [Methylobacterium sp. Leaf104]MCI9880275.1 GGDEF domain-containing protein [Methylobacterium goesingense]
MQIDLQTLWYLTVGTLLVSASLLLWERQAHPARAGLLGILAAGLFAFVLGCLVAMNRSRFPVALGMGATNLLMVTGYLLVLNAAAGFDGRRHVRASVAALGVLALVWAVAGTQFPTAFWNHVSALPIALACGLTAWILLRSRTVRGLRSRPVAAAISAVHAVFYLGRAFVAPLLVQRYGPDMLAVVAKATMYEAVLYSVAMPMSFLALVREEEKRHLLRLSHTDQLTGLANRHAFFAQGARMLAGRPVSLLAFDLDHFKAINDRYGHPAGDAILKLFAETARDGAGPDALLVRLGGEEFAALLPGCDRQQALSRGTAIASRFAAAAARADGPGIPATVSIGLAAPDARDLAELLASADGALYRAKLLGRNRIEAAAPRGWAAAA